MDGDVIGAIIFLILMGLSVVARYMESQKQKREKKWRMEDMPDETKRQVYGDTIPEHVRGRGTTKPLSEMRPPGVEMLEQLFGGARHDEDDEPDWQPVHQPAQRRELPRSLQQDSVRDARAEQAPPPIVAPPPMAPRQQQRPLQQRPKTRPPQQQPQRRQAPKPRPAQPARQAQQAPTRPAVPPPPAASRAASVAYSEGAIARDAERLRHIPTEQSSQAARDARSGPVMRDLDDVRQAIVFAEILGPPRGLQRGPVYYDYPPRLD